MDGSCDKFLSGAAFAADQDATRGTGDLGDSCFQPEHRLAFSEQFIGFSDRALESLFLLMEDGLFPRPDQRLQEHVRE